DRLVRQRDQFQVGGATAEKHAFESVNFDQTSSDEIVSVGADQRLRSIHQFTKARTHCSRCRARRSGGQRTGSRHQSRCSQSSDLDELTPIGFSGHDRSSKVVVVAFAHSGCGHDVSLPVGTGLVVGDPARPIVRTRSTDPASVASVARMERSAIRVSRTQEAAPDFAALHPGYGRYYTLSCYSL